MDIELDVVVIKPDFSGTLTQSPPCSQDPSTSQQDTSSSISLTQHPSTPQHGTSAPSQGLSPSVRVSRCYLAFEAVLACILNVPIMHILWHTPNHFVFRLQSQLEVG